MSTSIVDALVITLGLDTSNYDKGQKNVSSGLKKTRDDAGDTAKYLESQGKRAAGFFSSIRNEILALAGVSLSVAGLTSFVKNTTQGLMQLSIQSQALGMSARALDGWGKAASEAGSSAEKITGTLGNFQNALQAFKSGDASSPIFKALAYLNADTGTTFHPANETPESLLRSVSGALQKERSGDRARYIAQMLGIDDATLQSMRAGTFVASAQRYTQQSGITDQDTKNAREFNRQMTEISQQFEKVGYILFNSLSPYVSQFLGYLTDLANWMSSHPREIKQAIDSIVGTLAEVAHVANQAADAVGGWGNAIKILIGLKLAGWLWSVYRAALAMTGRNINPGTGAGGGVIGRLGVIGMAVTAQETIAKPLEQKFGVLRDNPVTNFLNNDPVSAWLAKHKLVDGPRLIQSLKNSLTTSFGGDEQKNNAQNHPEDKAGEDVAYKRDEKSFWDRSLLLLKSISESVVPKASAAEVQPGLKEYAPNIPLNYKEAELGKTGKAFLQSMAGEFGRLEGKYNLPEGLLYSVAATESSGNPNALGPKTKYGQAQGPFQFMPGTSKELGINPLNPSQAAEGAAKYLSQLLRQTGGNLEKAIAAYNWGIGNVQKKGLDNAPEETRNYVPKVLAGLTTGAAATQQQSSHVIQEAAPQYHFGNVTINSPARSVDQLTADMVLTARNRTRVLGFNSGQNR